MKRALISSAVTIVLGSSINVEAGTAGLTGVWVGEYIWADLDAGGSFDFGPSAAQSWTFDFDNGTADIVNTYPVFTGTYTFHDTTITDNNDGTYTGIILWDAIFDNVQAFDIPIEVVWDIADTGVVTTVTAGTIPSDSPIFPGSHMTFDGYLNPVPIPSAVWLFGSGLLGLIGVARRKVCA